MLNNSDIVLVDFHGWRDQDPEKLGLDPSRPITVMYNSRKYLLEIGKRTSIPSDCAMIWFGDPRSGANVQSLRDDNGTLAFVGDRASEVRRLRLLYGGIIGDEANFDMVNIPLVTITRLDGAEVPMVLSDPEGKTTIEASQTVQGQDELLMMVKGMQERITFLTEQISMRNEVTAEAGLLEPSPVNDDLDSDAIPAFLKTSPDANPDTSEGIPVDTGMRSQSSSQGGVKLL